MRLAAVASTLFLAPAVDAIKAEGTRPADGVCGGKPMTFSQFQHEHKRTYREGTEEYAMRKALFEERRTQVEEHNCMPKGPWTAAVNRLADWTADELKGLHGYKRTGSRASIDTSLATRSGRTTIAVSPRVELPNQLSWENVSSIRNPRDQGQCGSCWAFAAETVLRSRAEIRGNSYDFSVSQIVACTPNPNECGGKGGCDGATSELAYEYLLQAGMATDKQFPYPYGGGQKACPADMRFKTGSTAAVTSLDADGGELHTPAAGTEAAMRGTQFGMTGWTKLPENKELPLVRALVQDGPVAIAIAAGSDWSFYSQGILTKEGCDQNHVINHAVTLYGYGSSFHPSRGTVKYWRIKNSWGEWWGEGGMIRLERLDKEEEYCGWDNQPEVGSGCKGGPKQVWVCGSCGILYDAVAPHFSQKPRASPARPLIAAAATGQRRGRRDRGDKKRRR